MRPCFVSVLLVLAAGCYQSPPYALANITAPAGFPSACVVLEMVANDSRSPLRKVVLRRPDQNAFRVAVFQDDWPPSATLEAYVPASCSDLQVKLARSPVKGVTFGSSPPEIDLDIPDPTAGSLAFVGSLSPLESGACSPPLQLEVRDGQGAPAVLSAAITATFSTSPSTGLEVFTDDTCATPVGSVVIGLAPSTTVRVRGGPAGITALHATAPDLAPAQTAVEVVPGPPASLAVTSAPQAVLAGDCSAAVTLELRDAAGNLAAARANLPLDGQMPAAFASLYSGPACATALPATIPAGNSQATVSFRPYTPSTATLTLTAGALPPATQTETTVPIARRSSCVLPATLTSIACPVNPAPLSRSRAFLFFQATNNNANPSEAQVRCELADPPTAINCTRVGSTGDVAISWSVVELAYATVQHATLSCNSAPGPARLNFPNPLNLDRTFLIYSESALGNTYQDDFRAAYFEDGGTSAVFENGANGCTADWAFSAQAVELAGAYVDRGLAATDAGALTVTGLPRVNAGTSFLLYSWAAATGGTVVCDRMVMGEMDTETSLRFTMGNGNAACPTQAITVAWERVQMRYGIVQPTTVTMGTGELVKNVTVPISYNNSRTLALSGGQAVGGQGGGQSAYAADDMTAEGIARHTLTGGNGLRLTRDSADAGSKWHSYVVEFQP